MKYALAAMCIGTIAYFVTLTLQSPHSRRDLDAWGDLLFISGMLTAFLVIIMIWGMFERLSDTTLATLVDDLFRRRSSGLVNLRVVFPGFVALPFTALAALHVLVLVIRRRLDRRHDA